MHSHILGSNLSHLPLRLVMSRRRVVASFCAMPALLTAARAQVAWPSQAVRIVLGQPAGSGTDPWARGIAAHLQAAFAQPFIVENVLGAGGVAAAALVARATDGHTLGIVLGGPTTTAKALNPNLVYDPDRDFRSISLLNRTPFVLTVHPGTFPGQRFADIVDYARAHPGRLSYASIGPGTTTHLAMEELKSQLGLDIVHVPYRGFPQASLDLIAGRCHLMFNISSAAAEHMAAGRLSAVAQTGATRLRQLADVPTLREIDPSSKPFFGWSGMVAPASLPEGLAQRIADVVRSALATDTAIRGLLDRGGGEILGTDPGELQAWQQTEAIRWNAIIAKLGLRSAE